MLCAAAKHSRPWLCVAASPRSPEFSFPVDADQGHLWSWQWAHSRLGLRPGASGVCCACCGLCGHLGGLGTSGCTPRSLIRRREQSCPVPVGCAACWGSQWNPRSSCENSACLVVGSNTLANAVSLTRMFWPPSYDPYLSPRMQSPGTPRVRALGKITRGLVAAHTAG